MNRKPSLLTYKDGKAVASHPIDKGLNAVGGRAREAACWEGIIGDDVQPNVEVASECSELVGQFDGIVDIMEQNIREQHLPLSLLAVGLQSIFELAERLIAAAGHESGSDLICWGPQGDCKVWYGAFFIGQTGDTGKLSACGDGDTAQANAKT